jgi:hypothetical protein
MIMEQGRRQNDSPSRVLLVGNNSGNSKWWSALPSALLRSSSTFQSDGAVDAGSATAVATSNKPTNKRVSFNDKVTIHQFRRLTTKSSPTSSSSKDGSGCYGCGLVYIGLGRHVKTSVHSLLKMEKASRTHQQRQRKRQQGRQLHQIQRHPRRRLVVKTPTLSCPRTETELMLLAAIQARQDVVGFSSIAVQKQKQQQQNIRRPNSPRQRLRNSRYNKN